MSGYGNQASVGNGPLGYHGGGASTGSEVEKRTDTIQSAQIRQDAANSELHNIISQLEERLSVALEVAPPQPAGLNAPTPVASNLAQRGHVSAGSTEAAIGRLNSIISRLQL